MVRAGLDNPLGVTQAVLNSPAHKAQSNRPTIAPGLTLAAGGGVFGLAVHRLVPALSSVLVALLAGMLLAGVLTSPRLAPGLTFGSRRVLRFGVALLGFELVAGQVLALGWQSLVCVAIIVTGGITGTMLIGSFLGVPAGRRLLIACGFSICGAAAVAAADGVVESDEEDAATALGLVVAFGTLAMLLLPAVARVLGLDSRDAGAWLGGSIHEVGQVVVAGGIVGGVALQIAVLVKLTRVLMLGPVLVVLSIRARHGHGEVSGTRPPLVPFFVVAFAALVVLGSVLTVPTAIRSGVSLVQELSLATAMFALGAGVDVRLLRKLGSAELLLGVLSSVLVAALAFSLVLVG